MRLTLDYEWKPVLFVMAALLLAACNLGQSRKTGSGSPRAGDGGTGGGPCTNVVICAVIPLAQVNSATNKTLTTSAPSSTGTGPNSGDTCEYTGTDFVELIRFCADPGSNAGVQVDTDRNGYLAPGGTRTDVAGVGEKAFYQTEPTGSGLPTSKVLFEAAKGPIVVTFRASNVAPADDAMVKQGLSSFANTLLNAK